MRGGGEKNGSRFYRARDLAPPQDGARSHSHSTSYCSKPLIVTLSLKIKRSPGGAQCLLVKRVLGRFRVPSGNLRVSGVWGELDVWGARVQNFGFIVEDVGF